MSAPNTRSNLGRNTLTGPGPVNADLSMLTSFALEGRVRCRCASAFNALTYPNFAMPSGQIAFTNAVGDVVSNWGRTTPTVTTSRQNQLGVKYVS